jgi:hypothetical protein
VTFCITRSNHTPTSRQETFPRRAVRNVRSIPDSIARTDRHRRVLLFLHPPKLDLGDNKHLCRCLPQLRHRVRTYVQKLFLPSRIDSTCFVTCPNSPQKIPVKRRQESPLSGVNRRHLRLLDILGISAFHLPPNTRICHPAPLPVHPD